MTTVDIPQRHLIQETPEGTRWFYPVPVNDSFSSGLPETIGWETVDGVSLTRLRVDKAHRQHPAWLVSDAPLTVVVQVTQEHARLTGYERKPLGEVPEAYRALLSVLPPEQSGRFPERVTVQESADRCICNELAEGELCLWHQMLRNAYRAVNTRPEPVRTRRELVESQPLSGEPDPDPDRTWLVPDAVRAYYGGTVAHVLPGYLVPEPKAIGALLEQRLAELGSWTELNL